MERAGRLAASEVVVSQSEAAPGDQDLVDRAARGDHAAFEEIYFRYRDWVLNLAWRLTRDRELSLDVLQETFAYLVRRVPTLRLEGRLTTFLYPAVKHIAITQQRRAPPGDGPSRERLAPGPDPALAESQVELMRATAALPEAQREVVLMRFVSGMDLAEIAVALEIPVGTVKSRLHSALRTLGERLACLP